VTASEALPYHCKCQHLTKFVFGLWLRGPWTQAQLVEFQLALLVEFMHRARIPLELKHTPVTTPAEWVNAHVTLPPPAELLRHATAEEAWKAWARRMAPALALVRASDIIKDIAVTREVFRTRHWQFTYSAIAVMFRALWTLSGHGPYRFDVGTHALVSLLRTAAIGDNLARISDPCFSTPVEDPELYRMAASAAVHGAKHPPTLFLPDYVRRFEQAYRADIRTRYAVLPSGLSAVACCIPTCPHYLVPLSAGAGAHPGLHPRLRTHLDSVSVVPGLHKVRSLDTHWFTRSLIRLLAGRCAQAVQMLRDMNTLHTAAPGDVSAASLVLSLMVKTGELALLDGEVEGDALAVEGGVDSQTRGGQQRALTVQGHAMVLQDAAQHLLQPRQTGQPSPYKRLDVAQKRPLHDPQETPIPDGTPLWHPAHGARLTEASAGHCLEMEPVGTKALQARLDAVQAHAASDPYHNKRMVDAVRANVERSAADAKHKMASRLSKQVREAIDLHSAGDGRWLASFIERVVYSGVPAPAAYSVFEAHVLAAYRCPATGRYPSALTRPC
jgi:hypothetical protein